MRIFQVAESLAVGGAERVVVELSNALARRHSVSVVAMQGAGELAALLAPDIPFQSLAKPPGNDLRPALRLSRLLRDGRAEVVHVHHWGVYLDVALAGWLASVPVMVNTVHGLYPPYSADGMSRVKERLRHSLERFATRYCRRIVCVSSALERHVIEDLGMPAATVTTIPNGIAMGESPVVRPERSAEPFTVVALGRLAAVKNLPLLIDAAGLANRAGVPMRVLFAGEGPERAILERRVREQGLADEVTFLGFCADVDAVLRQADTLALSSLSEGSPMAVLEAMRAALPVVATRVGGVPDIVVEGKTGLLVESGNAQALAAALMDLAANRERAEAMGQAGRQRLLASFSLQSMVESYEALYRASV